MAVIRWMIVNAILLTILIVVVIFAFAGGKVGAVALIAASAPWLSWFLNRRNYDPKERQLAEQVGASDGERPPILIGHPARRRMAYDVVLMK